MNAFLRAFLHKFPTVLLSLKVKVNENRWVILIYYVVWHWT